MEEQLCEVSLVTFFTLVTFISYIYVFIQEGNSQCLNQRASLPRALDSAAPGHVHVRKWDGSNWLSSRPGQVSSVDRPLSMPRKN